MDEDKKPFKKKDLDQVIRGMFPKLGAGVNRKTRQAAGKAESTPAKKPRLRRKARVRSVDRGAYFPGFGAITRPGRFWRRKGFSERLTAAAPMRKAGVTAADRRLYKINQANFESDPAEFERIKALPGMEKKMALLAARVHISREKA